MPATMRAGSDAHGGKYVCRWCNIVDVKQGALAVGALELLAAAALLAAYALHIVAPARHFVTAGRTELFVSSAAWLAMGALTVAGVAAHNTALLWLAVLAHVGGGAAVTLSLTLFAIQQFYNDDYSIDKPLVALAYVGAGVTAHQLLVAWLTRVVTRAHEYITAEQGAQTDGERAAAQPSELSVQRLQGVAVQPAKATPDTDANGPSY